MNKEHELDYFEINQVLKLKCVYMAKEWAC